MQSLRDVELLRIQAFRLLDDCFRLTHAIPRDKDSGRYIKDLFILHKSYLKEPCPEDLISTYLKTRVAIFHLIKKKEHMRLWWFYDSQVKVNVELAKKMQLEEIKTR